MGSSITAAERCDLVPPLDPMSLIQVSLLRHKRAGETGEELHYALAATINGIAAIPARGARSPPRDSVSASA